MSACCGVLFVAIGEQPSRSALHGFFRCALATFAFCGFNAGPVQGQFSRTPTATELSTSIQLDEVDAPMRAALQRAEAQIAERQWDDAIESLRQLMEHQGDKLVRVDELRYLPLREFCQMRLAELPAEARKSYRARIDATAKQLYDEGILHRDAAPLNRLVEQMFLSSWTDKALYALGEMALEQANYREARWCWERISPELRSPDGLPLWLAIRSGRERPTDSRRHDEPGAKAWLAFPDTDLNLADVRARLVLVSIREGALARAKIELADFVARHPLEKGRIAGREVNYADTLRQLLTAAETAEAASQTLAAKSDWPTFAGSPRRTAIASPRSGFGTKIWEIPLVTAGGYQADVNIFGGGMFVRQMRVAEDSGAPGLLSFHPIVSGDLVLFNREDRIFAFNLRNGQPAWPTVNAADREPGEIYRAVGREMPVDQNRGSTLYHAWGAPRFTMTAVNNRLYARLGSPITAHPSDEQFAGESSYLVCLDLAGQGYLRWRTPLAGKDDDHWAYEGAPVCDGANVYVAMRYSDVRPREHVACFDAQTGAMRWRRLVCAAETPAQGQVEEITHNLLTLAQGVLYVNTNLGAVAALSASDGRVLWLTRYRRAKLLSSADQSHLYRDLNPCVYDRGNLYVAPTDVQGIYSFDASTGRMLWESVGAHDAVHLLGVAHDCLIASGRRLYWLKADGGKEVNAFPDQLTVQGYGRGALVGDQVYWPTRGDIRIFPQAMGAERKREVPDPIPVDGGNLIVAGDYLLIATPKKLVAYATNRAAAHRDEPALTRNDAPSIQANTRN